MHFQFILFLQDSGKMKYFPISQAMVLWIPTCESGTLNLLVLPQISQLHQQTVGSSVAETLTYLPPYCKYLPLH